MIAKNQPAARVSHPADQNRTDPVDRVLVVDRSRPVSRDNLCGSRALLVSVEYTDAIGRTDIR